MKTLFFKRATAALVALLLIFSAFPISTFAAPASDIPEEMLENSTLDALAYTGFKLQALMDAGLIYKSGGYGSSINSSYLSGISYNDAGNITGRETVSDASTVTGLAPNMAKFRSDGFVCASYVTYYFLNYLPNIKGVDTSFLSTAISNTGTNSQSVSTWVAAGNALVSAGKARKITSESDLQIGDVVIFTNGSYYPHVAIFAGEYGGRHFITHVGNDRGPEFSTIEGMGMAGDKSSYFAFAFSFPNIPNFQKNGRIEVYKKDTSGANLSGASFTVRDSKGDIYDVLGPTNSSGYACLEEVPYDTYTITEITFPKNYTANGTSTWTVTLNSATPNGTITINAVNKLKDGYIEVNKKDAVDGRNLSGAVFTVYDSGGTAVATIGPTNSSGYAISGAIQFGNYTVRETTMPANYQQPTNQWTVTLSDDTLPASLTYTLNITNNRQYSSVSVTKSAEDGVKENLTFRLQGVSVYGTSINMTASTNSGGVAAFSNVEIGNNYTLSEINTPDRYVIPPNQTAVIEWNTVTNKNFDNTLKKFRVIVTKKDSEYPYPQGDAKIEGAVYGLYNGSALAASYTTDQNGQFTTDYFVCGDNWTIREITESEGYLCDPTVYHVGAEARLYTVEYNNAPGLTSFETVKKGRVQIIKHSDDGGTGIETPEAGATFQLWLEKAGSYDAARPTERDILICDGNGMATSRLLPYGIYRVHQISGKPGAEKVKDFLCYVSEDGKTYPYIINNSAITAKIKVEKRNAEDGELIAAAGIGFQIKKPDGSLLVQEIFYPTPVSVSTFFTNTEGWLLLPHELEWGYGYQLIEVQTAPYFYLSDEPVPFDVTGETTFITVTKYNSPQKARIHVDKRGEVFSTVTLKDGIYRPQYAVQGLAGAVYEIYADEDIYLNNKLMVRKDTLVSTLTTTAAVNGTPGGATSPLLYLGRYRILERQAPFGMLGTNEVKTVTLSYRGQTVREYTEGVSFFNERQRVKIDFSKIMEQDELFKIGMNGEIAAVRMGLYADADIIAADGAKIPKDGLIEIVTVNAASGGGVFTVDLPVGARVYLRESATDNHFILSNQKYPLVFEYAGQDTPLVTLTANNGKPIPNTIKRGEVAGLKADENGKGLAGALIGLFAPDTTAFTKDAALLTDSSRADGAFSFEGIPYGEWVCREIATPGAAYVLDETAYPVTVTADKQIIRITITNIFVRGDIEGMKLDEDGQGLAGAVIGLFNTDETEFTEDNAVMTAVSGSSGSFTFEGVLYGGWLVREIAPPTAAFVLDDTIYPVTISTHKQIINVEITNIYVRGSIKGLKLGEDCKGLAGAVIGLFYPDETEFTEERAVMFTESDVRGRFAFEDILYGDWIVREIAPPRAFILSEVSYPVTVSKHKEIIRVSISNTLIRGSVEGIKTDEAGNGLAGALIGLFSPDETVFTEDTAVMTDTPAEDGSFTFTEIVFGEWLCAEIATPSAAYVLCDKTFPVTIAGDKEIIEIKIENRFVRGSVRTTKVDAEYPENKLAGAVFDVFADTNSNGEFDEGIDLFTGTLDEIEAGIYQLDGLLYSGYFLRERTAPDKFLLDENTYYFEILTDGETIEVENQAGFGFINQPITGELWLTKKDVSDGKLIPGCGIRIKDENGSTVVEGRTDENGEVKFTLRAGKYTYSEFDCPGYILDESEYPFEITEDGQIVKAEMTNEKIPEPEIPDNPKTGDNTNLGLWLGLAAVALGGLIAAIILKKKK